MTSSDPAARLFDGRTARALSWEIDETRLEEFRRAGVRARNVFPHRIRLLPRPGSDGARLARRMYDLPVDAEHVELVMHAGEACLRQLPRDIFFSRDLVWHQQHLDLPGHVAVAGLAVASGHLYTTARFSDIVQRIAIRRDLKRAVEREFRGWDYMVLNAILDFARRRGLREVRFPDADLAREHTDRTRTPGRELFDRVYDQHLQPWQPRRDGRTWVVEVASVAHRIVPAVAAYDTVDLGRTVCICHDTERGEGHRDVDPAFAAHADRIAPGALARMLEVEAAAGVRTTYAVVGAFLPEVRAAIETGGHAVAFHSYDHRFTPDQLRRCRGVDYRIPGYRAPQSRLDASVSDAELTGHNVEWLASSRRSFGFDLPRVERGVARLPIAFDDYPLHTGAADIDAWEARLMEATAAESFLAIGLHDCYADRWLHRYDNWLARLAREATLRTLDEVSHVVTRVAAI